MPKIPPIPLTPTPISDAARSVIANNAQTTGELIHPTMALRFIKREQDGRTLRILQQLYVIATVTGDAKATRRNEWRDIPEVLG